MKIAYTVATSGDMSGTLHFRVIADESFDPIAAVDHITNYKTNQPLVVVIHDDYASHESLIDFCRLFKKTLTGTLVLSTKSNTPAQSWYAFDRVVLDTTVHEYTGIPVHEAHLRYVPGDSYPITAPLGAQSTHIYVYADTDRNGELVKWVREAPFAMGIIRRPL